MNAGRFMSPPSPECYEIRVEGVLDPYWTAWFSGLQITSAGTDTIISGLMTDQSALYGVLVKISDLGLRLISVRRISPGEAGNVAPDDQDLPCGQAQRTIAVGCETKAWRDRRCGCGGVF